MATKKVFTSLEFGSGALLKKSKIELVSDANDLTGNDPTFSASAGQLAYAGDTNLYLGVGATWSKLLRVGQPISTASVITSTLASDSGNAPPFVVASTDTVANLSAERLDGKTRLAHDSFTTGGAANKIPSYGANGTLKVGTPTDNHHAATKAYADSVGQGLTIIDPCYLATTAALPNHSYNNGTNGVGATMTASANGSLSIDGNAVSDGKRILVKDQANNAHNGIYTVTNEGSGSAAFVLTRATDYDEQGELLDGDFVFVQEGTVNANRGFVQTSNFWTATTGTVGTHSITWTQFSGAGQISVTSNGSAAAPLTKSGDTINFGYNTAHFTTSGAGQLLIRDGSATTGISTSLLRDNAVTADKLDDSASFTMGGLTVNGATAVNDSIFSLVRTGGSIPTGIMRFNGSDSSIKWDVSIGQKVADTFEIRRNTSPFLFINNAGKTGIGADASSPSGTIHVSTARYGSEEVEDGTFPNLNNWTAASSFSAANNTASCDGSQSGYVNLLQGGVFTGGRKYRLKMETTRSAGSFKVWAGSPAILLVGPISSTQNIDQVVTPTNSGNLQIEVDPDFVGTFKNISVTEDNFASGVDSDANDLVVNGNSKTGISIISRAAQDAALYFGDGLDNNFSSIASVRALDSTGTLKFSVSGLALTLDSSQNAKFEGGVGIGMAAATAQLLSIKGDNKYIGTWAADGSQSAVLGTDADGDGFFKLYDNGGDGKIQLNAQASGVSYINNGGSVVIGTTTGETGADLTLYGASDTSLCIHTYSDNANEASSVKFKTLATGSKTAYQKGTLFYKGGGSETVASGYGVGSFIFAIKNVGTSVNATIADAILELKPEGHQDHKANPIVNSATVAGLQDGACYDFDGTDDYIVLGSVIDHGTNDFSYAAWVKIDTFSGSPGIVSNRASSGTNVGCELRLAANNGIQLFIDFGSNTASVTKEGLVTGKWYHVVATVDRDGYANLYLDGVSEGTPAGISSLSSTSLTSGADVRIGRNEATTYLDGSIRDVKIFPSALTAGDIRKLYSGENPKKNTDLKEYISIGDFSSNPSNTWNFGGNTGPGGASNWSISTNAAQFTTTGSGTSATALYQSGVFTANDAGKTFILKFTIGGSNTNGIWIGNASGSTPYVGSAYIAYAAGTHTVSFVLPSNVTDIAFYARNSSSSFSLDDVSIKQANTLVELTPQSASSTQWRNEAIPALYHGTVNNATLSQGNTYWNNIKQSERNITLNGHFTDDANHNNYRVGIKNNDPQDTLHIGTESLNRHGTIRIAGFNNNEYWRIEPGTNTLGIKDWNGTSLFTLNGSSNAVQINDKLGVGGAADATHSLLVNGSSKFANDIVLSNTSPEIHFNVLGTGKYNWLVAAQESIDKCFEISSGSTDEDSSNDTWTPRFVINGQTGNTGIGTNTPANLLHLSGADESMLMLQANSGSTGDKFHIGFGCSTVMLSGTNIGARLTFERRGASTGGDLSFHTRPVSGTLTERFVLRDDGTHDHNANRIVNSQTVSDSWRSSEPSLRFDGSNDYVQVADTTLNNPSNGTISAWVRYNSFSQSTNDYLNGAILAKGNIYFTLTNNSDKKIVGYTYFGAGGGAEADRSLTGATVLETGKWYHVLYTFTSSSETIYVNGVQEATRSGSYGLGNINSSHVGEDCRIGAAGEGGTVLSYFNGEIKDVRIHNRALEAGEIQGLYNGEATPFIYADSAGNVTPDTANSDASIWTKNQFYNGSAWVTDATLTFDTDHMEVANNNAAYGVYLTPATMGITATVGKRYRISAKFKNGTASGISVRLQAYPLTGDGLVDHTTTSSFVEVSTEFTATAAFTQVGVWPLSDLNGSNIEFKDFRFEEVGEVAAYTPKSINDKWYDTTSNANHGTITGATAVGDNHYRGVLTVKGDSPKGGTHGTPSSDWANTNSSGAIYLGETAAAQGRIDFDYSASDGSTCLSVDNTNAASGAKTSFGMKTAGTRLPVLELIADGSVKATNANGGLKQVARTGTSTSIGLIDGDGSKTHFTITHNLGTELVVVSVREKLTPFSFVEAEVRSGSWSDNSTMVPNSQYDKVTVIFATAPAVNTDFYVTVIG